MKIKNKKLHTKAVKTLDETQKEAFHKMLDMALKIFMITGGGGVGKTYTTVQAIKELVLMQKDVVVITTQHSALSVLENEFIFANCAPAKQKNLRLQTIASFFELLPIPNLTTKDGAEVTSFGGDFVVPEGLGNTIVFVDECSMISETVRKELCDAAEKGEIAKLIFSGDLAQLPPVKAKRPNFDGIEFVELRTAHRARDPKLAAYLLNARDIALGRKEDEKIEMFEGATIVSSIGEALKSLDGEEDYMAIAATNDAINKMMVATGHAQLKLNQKIRMHSPYTIHPIEIDSEEYYRRMEEGEFIPRYISLQNGQVCTIHRFYKNVDDMWADAVPTIRENYYKPNIRLDRHIYDENTRYMSVFVEGYPFALPLVVSTQGYTATSFDQLVADYPNQRTIDFVNKVFDVLGTTGKALRKKWSAKFDKELKQLEHFKHTRGLSRDERKKMREIKECIRDEYSMAALYRINGDYPAAVDTVRRELNYGLTKGYPNCLGNQLGWKNTTTVYDHRFSTVHKAQGAGAEVVIIHWDSAMKVKGNKQQMLYTAVSRAKARIIIIKSA